jgi:hypothetical protein
VTKFSTARIVGSLFVAAVAVLSLRPAVGNAAVLLLDATQDQSVESSFTFDFGAAFGGPRSASISETEYQLAVDPDAPNGLSAAFLSYDQSVDSIMLPSPGGDIPTGALTISIEESYGGTYNEATGLVTTEDLYRIEFTGDLSMFGFFSPVFLPGESSGQVDFLTATAGNIELNWAGAGFIGPPELGIPFTYTCASNSTFTVVPEPATLSLLGLAAVSLLRRRR